MIESSAVSTDKIGHLTLPTLVVVIADDLRHRILRGQFTRGERLSEVSLAQQLGVSRPPLREAMRLLQKEGLLSSEPRRGMFVTPLTAEDVREIYGLRTVLENFAIDQALPLEDPTRLRPLHDSVERMRQFVADGDLAELTLENLRFHRGLTALADHKRLQSMYESIMGQLQMCMAMNLRFRESLINDHEDVARRHETLVTSLEAGDPEVAKQVLANHGDRSFLADLDHLLSE